MNQATLLGRLVERAGLMLAHPKSIYTDVDRDAVADLVDAIAHERAKPAPDGRAIGDEEWLLAYTLGCIVMAGGNGRARTLYQVAGVLLPHVRGSFARALEAQKFPQKSD